MTESQADIIRKDPNVGSIGKSSSSYDPFMSVPNTIPHLIQKRNEGLLRQRRAANEMKFISQPYEFPDVFNFDEYVYDRAAGVGITVYISDTGANLTNPEFQQGSNIAQRVRWLFGQGGGNINTDQTDISALGHGTCMLDKVGGNKYGVAKRVNPVIVRAAHFHYDALLDTVRQIRADYDQIYNQDPKHARAIVNLSWGFPPTELGDNKDAWINEIRRELQILVSKGVSIVVPAGNEPFNKPIDKYPQRLAGESGNDGVPEMIVVGGIEVYDGNIGKLYERSQTADYVSVYAPSFKINCANANGGLRIREEVAGTSHASAQVAGLAAYFLSLTDNQDYLHDDDGRQRVIKLKDFII
ncbi:MAG: hypothetical protein L6R42_011193, partial [Xanthoria sp. 1 TBL-2021]